MTFFFALYEQPKKEWTYSVNWLYIAKQLLMHSIIHISSSTTDINYLTLEIKLNVSQFDPCLVLNTERQWNLSIW